ncbi:selenocysteine-specific translation elongation factor [Undibacterium sp. RuRC25W]|uniref:selenocysteine-specific translation elongation factor n=1 Tax=Undibacterium sp. RuRC25W TaxID=3413047 RepID=UPI003BEF9973
MIVGTAGHIDHGKTTLSRALTGVDTDRLKEEKARGISIELGYAYTPLPNGDVLGLIDVPGHEKLIHTMAAGASGIDYALLVIAADDGVMPQTREHLTILELLGIQRGVVALTKVDRVDAERIAAVKAEITHLLAPTSFAGAPIFPTQAHLDHDPGVAELKAHLMTVAQSLAQKEHRRLFRLAIDRVFNLSGKGLFIAGTASAGEVAIGDTITLAPSGRTVRVRSIHAQNRPVEAGYAGQRLSMNVVGIEKEQVARGDWAVASPMAECSERVDVDVQLIESAGLQLKPWSQVHVHLGAAHRVARVLMLEGETIEPGQRARAQLVFDRPVHTVPGDRFVIRNAQALRTIGGGRVLDPFGPARKRRSAERRAWLDALSDYLGTDQPRVLIAHSNMGIRRSMLTRLTQRPSEQLHQIDDAIEIDLRGEDAIILSDATLTALNAQIVDALRQFHTNFPDETGPQHPRLKRIVAPEIEDALWRAVIEKLTQSGGVIAQGPWLRLPEHSVELDPEQQALADALLRSLHAAVFDPPWVRDLAKEHQRHEEVVRSLLRKLALRGQVYQIVRDLYCHPQRIAELAQLAESIAVAPSQNSAYRQLNAAAFRDVSGMGRKRAIQFLEFFDRVGYTRRLRDAHVVRTDSLWQAATMQ